MPDHLQCSNFPLAGESLAPVHSSSPAPRGDVSGGCSPPSAQGRLNCSPQPAPPRLGQGTDGWGEIGDVSSFPRSGHISLFQHKLGGPGGAYIKQLLLRRDAQGVFPGADPLWSILVVEQDMGVTCAAAFLGALGLGCL